MSKRGYDSACSRSPFFCSSYLPVILTGLYLRCLAGPQGSRFSLLAGASLPLDAGWVGRPWPQHSGELKKSCPAFCPCKFGTLFSSLLLWAETKNSIFFLIIVNCGKRHTTLIILTILKCTVQWCYIHSYCCATVTTIHLQNSFHLQTETPHH